MKPLDPRLLQHAGAARGYLIVTICLGLPVTALILAHAGLLAYALASAASGTGLNAWAARCWRCSPRVPPRPAAAYSPATSPSWRSP